MFPGTNLHVLLENEVNHHYVGGYYGAASEEEMKRELVSCRNSRRSRVHNVVGNPHFWKVIWGVVGRDIHGASPIQHQLSSGEDHLIWAVMLHAWF